MSLENVQLFTSEMFDRYGNVNICYGTCTTAAATAAKVVTVDSDSFTAYKTGQILIVKFTYAQSASSCTLNVNSFGAKTAYARMNGNSAINSTYGWSAGAFVSFVYDGSYFRMLNNGKYAAYNLATSSYAGLMSTTHVSNVTKSTKLYQVGTVLITSAAATPASDFGGTWEELDNHLFLGLHLYKRTA
jgi:hypothetical protein